jgi:pimeloyl-ACP methyl ester carboxylesterase
MSTLRHCTAVAALLTLTAGLGARQPEAGPATGDASFEVFVRGTRAGAIRTNLARSGGDWVVSSTGGFGDLTINRFEARYSADWQPQRLQIEASQGQRRYGLSTSFTVTTAVNEITQNGQTSSKTDQISARAVLLPNNFFAAYEALAPRLAASAVDTEIPIYVAPQAEVTARVTDVNEETLQSPQGTIHIRTFTLSLANPGGAVVARVTIDGRQRFAKLEIPAAGVTVVRQDVSGVGTRTQTFRNPTDTDVTIPATGFVLAGTLTMPPGVEGRLRHPTILLVPGSGRLDRDETVAGIPIFAQLAGALAKQGFMVLRYDKRGVGQSGGRTETATLQDYAADVIDIVRWLDDRKDVDDRHLTVLGHSEGGAVAMLAATREKKIDALVLVGTPGSTGAELILEQQRHVLDLLKTAPEERDQKIALQKKIQEAVVSGKGWEGVPDDLRAQADTPWFRSLLEFDPAEVMPKIKQPILIVQGDLDTQVPPAHGERLAELARARKDDDAVTEVVHLPGVNHLLVPAKTGEVSEYPSLAESPISAEAATMIGNWLRR